MAEDRPRPSLDDPHAWVPYRYHPSQVAAIVFVVLFALTTSLHTLQLIKKKTWYFIPLFVGGLCTRDDLLLNRTCTNYLGSVETIGYVR